MASSMSESNVVHDGQSVSLPSADSSGLIPTTNPVSTSSTCENRKVDARDDTQQWHGPQSGVDSAEVQESKNSPKIGTLDSLQESDEKSTSKVDIIRPLYKYIKNNKCMLCGFECKGKGNISARSHLLVHVTGKNFRCNVCDKKFSTEYNMFMHSFVHSGMFNSGVEPAEEERPENAVGIGTIDELPAFDKRCTMNRKNIRPLYKYMKNKKCLLCGFESKAKDLCGMRNHLFVHVTSKEFKCDICDKKFPVEGYLMKHRLVHSDECTFSCDLCDKKYRSIVSLRSHKRRKHEQRQKKFKCEFCGKVLTTNFAFKEHLRIHTGERPFVCALCKKTFRVKSLFSHHLRRHSATDKSHRLRHRTPSSHDLGSSSGMVSATSKTVVDRQGQVQ